MSNRLRGCSAISTVALLILMSPPIFAQKLLPSRLRTYTVTTLNGAHLHNGSTGIARNQLSMFWRRRKAGERARHRLGIPLEPIDETTATELREAERLIDGAEAVEALNTLPDKLRSAVVLRVVDQLGYAEIAAELGCNPGAARVRVFRGLQRLNEILK